MKQLESWSSILATGQPIRLAEEPNGLGRFLLVKGGWLIRNAKFPCIIKGDYCPIVGRVSDTKNGLFPPEELPLKVTKVTLIDPAGPEEITATEVADTGTINYEVACLLSDRFLVTIKVKNKKKQVGIFLMRTCFL